MITKAKWFGISLILFAYSSALLKYNKDSIKLSLLILLSSCKYIPPPILAVFPVIIDFLILKPEDYTDIYKPPPKDSATLLIILHDLIYRLVLKAVIATPWLPLLKRKLELII